MKRLIWLYFVSLEAFKIFYVMRVSAPSLHRESTNSVMEWIIYDCTTVLKVAMHIYKQKQQMRPGLCVYSAGHCQSATVYPSNFCGCKCDILAR